MEGSRCLPARCSCSPRVHAAGVSCLLRAYRAPATTTRPLAVLPSGHASRHRSSHRGGPGSRVDPAGRSSVSIFRHPEDPCDQEGFDSLTTGARQQDHHDSVRQALGDDTILTCATSGLCSTAIPPVNAARRSTIYLIAPCSRSTAVIGRRLRAGG